MNELLHINVNDRIEKKNGLSYLSWAWAWAEVLRVDPEASWEHIEYPQPDGTLAPCMYFGGSTAMVKTAVTIHGRRRVCILPVMDHRNKAIPNPDAFAVNTAIMRCMTKAISMHGLGLYIYAGEDLPVPPPETGEDKAAREAKEKREQELRDIAMDMLALDYKGKQLEAIRIWYAIPWDKDNPTASEEQKLVWSMLRDNSKLRAAIKANKPEPTELEKQLQASIEAGKAKKEATA